MSKLFSEVETKIKNHLKKNKLGSLIPSSDLVYMSLFQYGGYQRVFFLVGSHFLDPERYLKKNKVLSLTPLIH